MICNKSNGFYFSSYGDLGIGSMVVVFFLCLCSTLVLYLHIFANYKKSCHTINTSTRSWHIYLDSNTRKDIVKENVNKSLDIVLIRSTSESI